MIETGLAKVDYIYGNYKYVEQLEEKQEKAKLSKIGIWQEEFKDELEDVEKNITIDNNESGNIIINLIFIICGIILLWIGKFVTKIRNKGKEQSNTVESDKREIKGN